jgi:hypothetical protein
MLAVEIPGGRVIPGLPPLARIGLAFVCAGLITLLSPPGNDRRSIGGVCFAIVAGRTIMDYGDRIGLHAFWPRMLVGGALAMALLLATNPPGYLKRPLERLRARRRDRPR